MSSIKHSILILAGAGVVAATLQGSRLPEDVVPDIAVVAHATSSAHRPGPGSERDEDPPIWDGYRHA
jgi:hypothetical protein